MLKRILFLTMGIIAATGGAAPADKGMGIPQYQMATVRVMAPAAALHAHLTQLGR